MDEPLLKKLDRRIKALDLGGRSEAIRQAVRDWLARQATRKKVQREILGYRKHPVSAGEFGPLIDIQELPH